MKRGNTHDSINPEAIAYLHGRIDKEIEIFAATSVHVNAGELAERLGELLLAARVRIENHLSTLRESTTQGDKTLATVEMVSGPHSITSRKGMTDEAKEKLRKIAKARWAAMTPRQRTLTLNKMARARLEKVK
jgi:hypothetical protein